MKITTNYHTHTSLCDGRDDARTMINTALDKGFTELGFSGHSYTSFDEEACMSRKNTESYRTLLAQLKKEYSGRISILAGIEQDYFSKEPVEAYDYVIGSVHYTLKDGAYLAVDDTREKFIQAVNDHYDGDVYQFVEDYYRLAADVVNKTKADIIGHLDLITKFNENSVLFDENATEYVNAVDRALQSLVSFNVPFEVNTGAMSRGYRSNPYPAFSIIDKIYELKGKIIISSDAHSAKNIDFGFTDVTRAILKRYSDKNFILTKLFETGRR